MKERSIILKTSEILAALNGEKIQRIDKVKSALPNGVRRDIHQSGIDNAKSVYQDGSGHGFLFHSFSPRAGGAEWTVKQYPGNQGINCPLGKVGDRLWVRETWAIYESCKYWTDCGYEYDGEFVLGKLDPNRQYSTKGGGDWEGKQRFVTYRATDSLDDDDRWRPSVHMPRWASRITLEITDIKVEREPNGKSWNWVVELTRTDQ